MLNVRAHLVHCPSCEVEHQELRHLRAALQNSPDIEPPEHMAERIMLRIRSEETPKSRARTWFLPILAGVAATSLVTAAIYIATQPAASEGATVATEIRSDDSSYSSADPLSGGHLAFATNYDTR
jgi:anti-sigma factor RsiW